MYTYPTIKEIETAVNNTKSDELKNLRTIRIGQINDLWEKYIVPIIWEFNFLLENYNKLAG